MKLTKDMKLLKAIEERLSYLVCSVHGHITLAEANALLSLREKTGMEYDPINRQWSKWVTD